MSLRDSNDPEWLSAALRRLRRRLVMQRMFPVAVPALLVVVAALTGISLASVSLAVPVVPFLLVVVVMVSVLLARRSAPSVDGLRSAFLVRLDREMNAEDSLATALTLEASPFRDAILARWKEREVSREAYTAVAVLLAPVPVIHALQLIVLLLLVGALAALPGTSKSLGEEVYEALVDSSDDLKGGQADVTGYLQPADTLSSERSRSESSKPPSNATPNPSGDAVEESLSRGDRSSDSKLSEQQPESADISGDQSPENSSPSGADTPTAESGGAVGDSLREGGATDEGEPKPQPSHTQLSKVGGIDKQATDLNPIGSEGEAATPDRAASDEAGKPEEAVPALDIRTKDIEIIAENDQGETKRVLARRDVIDPRSVEKSEDPTVFTGVPEASQHERKEAGAAAVSRDERDWQQRWRERRWGDKE